LTGLSVRGLTVQRGGRMVLEDVSFSAPEGAITAVLGGAGAGKTSLLAAIAGLLPPERGAVLRDDTDVTRLSARRRGVALLPPGFALPESRPVHAALRRLAGRRAAPAIDTLLSELGLTLAPRQTAGLLSHGAGFLALAAARLLPPGDVLLLDEAGTGLDEESRARVSAAMRQAADAGRTVVMATRSPSVALSADHLILLGSGRVMQAGRPASLYAEPRSGEAALLTGAANFFAGKIREVRPGGFVWAGGGGRYVQVADADMPRPVLGGEVTLCLRPERIALLAAAESAENLVEAEITDLRSAGALLHVRVRSALGDLLVAVPSWRPAAYPATGQRVRLGWAADAAWMLP